MNKREIPRKQALLGLILAVAIGGALTQFFIAGRAVYIEAAGPGKPPEAAPLAAGEPFAARFEHAVMLLHTKRFAAAEAAWQALVREAPGLPEARVNLGFSLLGLGQNRRARAAFERALDLHAGQQNAYYGLALCYEREGDLELALGAMRVFVHLGGGETRHQRKAMAAIWEWSAKHRQAAERSDVGIEQAATTGNG